MLAGADNPDHPAPGLAFDLLGRQLGLQLLHILLHCLSLLHQLPDTLHNCPLVCWNV
jgi:hypothetical protein